jgi:hypothetical protein
LSRKNKMVIIATLNATDMMIGASIENIRLIVGSDLLCCF